MKSLSLSRPHAIIMVGIPGSGKSFFAKKFADTFNAPYVDYGSIATIIGSPVDATVQRLIQMQLTELLKTKQSVVIEGGASTRVERTSLVKLLKMADYEPLFVWVQTDHATALTRALRPKNTTSSQPLTEVEHTRSVKQFHAPHAVKDNLIVISGKHTYATQAKVVLTRLTNPRAEISAHVKPPTRLMNDVRRSRQ